MKDTNKKESYNLVMRKLEKTIRDMEISHSSVGFCNIIIAADSNSKATKKDTDDYFRKEILQPAVKNIMGKGYYCFVALYDNYGEYTVYFAREIHNVLLITLADKLVMDKMIEFETYIALRGKIFGKSDEAIKKEILEFNPGYYDDNEEDEVE